MGSTLTAVIRGALDPILTRHGALLTGDGWTKPAGRSVEVAIRSVASRPRPVAQFTIEPPPAKLDASVLLGPIDPMANLGAIVPDRIWYHLTSEEQVDAQAKQISILRTLAETADEELWRVADAHISMAETASPYVDMWFMVATEDDASMWADFLSSAISRMLVQQPRSFPWGSEDPTPWPLVRSVAASASGETRRNPSDPGPHDAFFSLGATPPDVPPTPGSQAEDHKR